MEHLIVVLALVGIAFGLLGCMFFVLINGMLWEATQAAKKAPPTPQYVELSPEDLAHLLSHTKQTRPKTTKPYN